MSREDSTLPWPRNAAEGGWFPIPTPLPPAPAPVGPPRRRRADRQQVVLRAAALDSLLPDDHRARVVWEYVQGVDLSPLYAGIRAVQGRAGRAAADPGILLALWLYATLEGVGAARQVARLCAEHAAYQWICGGVSMNQHTLSDFRVDQPEFLNHLLTQSAAPAGRGAAACGTRAFGAHPAGPGRVGGDRGQEESGRRESPGARLDDGSGGPGDEDGRRGLPAGA